jgi:L-asparaginase
MTTKHIGLIYTGGTVGMTKTADGYAPMKDFARVLSKLLGGAGDALPRYSLYQYAVPIDSSNATPEDWNRIGRDIAGRYGQHDGFVVLHGTDTMAYTASALSFMLQGLRKPVILTGSQIPLGEARSDALQNLVGAMQLAASDAISEVAIFFSQRLLRGNRASKISAERLDAFDSPGYPPLGEVGIGIRLDAAAMLPRAPDENFELADYEQGRIVPLRFVPGLPLQAVRAMLDLNPRALILQCYGAGNIPDRDPALLQLLAGARERGIVVAACSQAAHGRIAFGAYATGAGLAKAGVAGAGDMTFEALFAKLHHLFAQGLAADEVKARLLHSLSGEVTAA